VHTIRKLLHVALLSAVPVTLALGHSASQSTVPADGATLDTPPQHIRIRFDQPIRLTLVRLTDGDGRRYEVSFEQGEATTRFQGDPPSLGSGTYTIEWRGLSADGHPASGEFSFRIQ
jgi:hypothetical protein